MYVEVDEFQASPMKVKRPERSAELVALVKAIGRVDEAIVLLKFVTMVTVLLPTLTIVEDVGAVVEPVGVIVSNMNAGVVEVAAGLPSVSTAPVIFATTGF